MWGTEGATNCMGAPLYVRCAVAVAERAEGKGALHPSRAPLVLLDMLSAQGRKPQGLGAKARCAQVFPAGGQPRVPRRRYIANTVLTQS